MVISMTTDFGAGIGAHNIGNPNIPVNWSNEVNLMNEELARAHSREQQTAWRSREREFAQQLVVARAQRAACWAERIAAYAARRADSRRKRATRLASSLR